MNLTTIFHGIIMRANLLKSKVKLYKNFKACIPTQSIMFSLLFLQIKSISTFEEDGPTINNSNHFGGNLFERQCCLCTYLIDLIDSLQ